MVAPEPIGQRPYLLAASDGTRLHLGPEAVVEITGLRNPCVQLDGLQPGLMEAVLDRDDHGNLIRKAGVMAVVVGLFASVTLPAFAEQNKLALSSGPVDGQTFEVTAASTTFCRLDLAL